MFDTEQLISEIYAPHPARYGHHLVCCAVKTSISSDVYWATSTDSSATQRVIETVAQKWQTTPHEARLWTSGLWTSGSLTPHRLKTRPTAHLRSWIVWHDEADVPDLPHGSIDSKALISTIDALVSSADRDLHLSVCTASGASPLYRWLGGAKLIKDM
jgi:hypothetical protein